MTPIERFWKDKNNTKYDTYLLGMSHSVNGIIEALLPGNTYKFSAPSMDLYYQRLVLRELEEKGALSHCKRILLEMPYYIFNYDASKCKNVMPLRLAEYGYFGDYHHYQGPKYETTEEAISSPSLLYRGILRKPYVSLRLALSKKDLHSWTEEELCEIKALTPHVWYKDYPDTVNENKEIWEEIRTIAARNEITITVLVLPFHPCFLKYHGTVIDEKRLQFEGICGDIQMLNYLDSFADGPGCFDDECHLNLAGAYAFTKRLKKDI